MPPFIENTPRFPQLPNIELPPFLSFLKLASFPLKTYPPVSQPKRSQKDTLYIYGPGLRASPSISFDVDCIQTQIYFRFCNLDVDIKFTNDPEASPSGKLPYFSTVTGKLLTGTQIDQWLKDNEKDISLGTHQDEAIAFISMVKSKLHPALLFSMWLEPLNYNENTFRMYYGHIPAPINSIMGYRKKEEIVNQLLANRDILSREEVYADAAQTLEALSIKLGDYTYFFDQSGPTWMDAVVFSYLHVILGVPPVSKSNTSTEERNQAATLRKLVQKHQNLVRYAKHINEHYLK
ncbi:uncharacterized protein BX664DRAFT_338986 [Halteromyces radiatus]|uniref:uncharacterized protein n=1 Tax=Halteromyces radiatus TaxID=101107 RepID=UPI00221ED598|nr:uncharacterized protein BX664DRAFT_338986 [Halteromyces radiatus]KAI8082754.1 hypothetical protein BX664DRAFT_338986 [Halteromyces radiatus]